MTVKMSRMSSFKKQRYVTFKLYCKEMEVGHEIVMGKYSRAASRDLPVMWALRESCRHY